MQYSGVEQNKETARTNRHSTEISRSTSVLFFFLVVLCSFRVPRIVATDQRLPLDELTNLTNCTETSRSTSATSNVSMLPIVLHVHLSTDSDRLLRVGVHELIGDLVGIPLDVILSFS